VRLYAFCCTVFVRECPDEMSCFVGPIRSLHMRFHACLAVMRLLDEITCFLADIRKVERCVLKDAED
jgi:hypothetical protein